MAFEDLRLTFEFCARRGWSDETEADSLYCEVIHEFREDRWEPGEVLRVPVDRRDFDNVLDRVQVSLESRVGGNYRSTMTALTRSAITQGRQIGPEPGYYSFEQVWPVPGPIATPLGVS